MFSRAKSNLFLCFSQILTKFAIFAKPSLGMACPVVVLRLIERLLRCMKLNGSLDSHETRTSYAQWQVAVPKQLLIYMEHGDVSHAHQ